jgi:RecA/RadA recombinase
MLKPEYRSGLDVFREFQSKPHLATWNLDLDSLLAGGLETGSFTIFYGDDERILDRIAYLLLCNCQLPVETYGLNGKAVLLSCGDYRQEQVLLDLKLATSILTGNRIDAAKGLNDIISVSTFNHDQAAQSIDDIINIVKYNDQVRLVVVRNLAKLFIDKSIPPKNKLALERTQQYQHLLGKLWQVCSARGIALVVTCRPRTSNTLHPSPPEGGLAIRHLAQTIVCIKKREENSKLTAHLLKHPNRQPHVIEFDLNQSDSVMGRLTIPFRSQLQEEIENLTRSFKEALMDPARRDAFDSLTKAWTAEQGAMSYAKIPSVLETMLLAACVDNRKLIDDLQDQISLLKSQLDKTRSELSETKITLKTSPGVTD